MKADKIDLNFMVKKPNFALLLDSSIHYSSNKDVDDFQVMSIPPVTFSLSIAR